MEVNIDLIVVKDRHRKDFGDIDSLAKSIEYQGLLQPIGIDSNYNLIFGERRLRAHKRLGLKTINANILNLPSLLMAERDENELHKGFTPSERVSIARALEDELKANERRGRPSDEIVENFPQFDGKKSRDLAAEKAGFGNGKTYQQAKKVVDTATPEVVESMDSGNLSINAAAKVATLPEEEQREVIAEIQSGEKPSEVVKKHVHVAQNSGNNEWYTPQEYIDAARAVLGRIDLDPASNPAANEVVKAGIFYSAENSGLDKSWAGNVWMNPPYSSSLIGSFVTKLVEHYGAGDIEQAIVLVNNATDTGWFAQLTSVATSLCFPKGRIRFWAPDKSSAAPLQGQAFLYFGSNPDIFETQFSSFGLVARVVR